MRRPHWRCRHEQRGDWPASAAAVSCPVASADMVDSEYASGLKGMNTLQMHKLGACRPGSKLASCAPGWLTRSCVAGSAAAARCAQHPAAVGQGLTPL
jgi:hypothetical protein